jgi:hypothetical protein
MRVRPALCSDSFLLVFLLTGGILCPSGLHAQAMAAGTTSHSTIPSSSERSIERKHSKTSPARQTPSKAIKGRATAAPSAKLPPIIVVLTPTGMAEPLGEARSALRHQWSAKHRPNCSKRTSYPICCGRCPVYRSGKSALPARSPMSQSAVRPGPDAHHARRYSGQRFSDRRVRHQPNPD